MRRILLTTAAGVFVLGAAGAMAQSAPPAPNASGSQVTNPNTYRDTVAPQAVIPGQPLVTGTCPPVPNASGSQVTNPCTYGSTANDPALQQGGPAATGSITVPPPPVPNASGSQVTNPQTYRSTIPQ